MIEVVQLQVKILQIKSLTKQIFWLEKGNCYIWGGEPLSDLGGENYEGIVNLKQELGINDCKIMDVALGYMHTLVVVEEWK